MLTAENLTKTYRRNADIVRVLNGVSLAVRDGEFMSIVGASGSGKSTLLHVLGTLDAPDSGTISLDGKRLDNLSNRERDAVRNRTFGYVFQFYHLLPELSAIDNALMPAYISNSFLGWMQTRRQWRRRADELFERVGLSHRKTHKPREMSGGEMQRCAIARALLQRPRVLLADEPTGNLDAEKGNEILELLHDLNRQDRVTIVMVTHNLEMAGTTHRTIRLAGGRVVEEKGPTFRPRLMQAAV
ncbi:MAG: ABC transporter ATP-binding protein [Gemmataceae bacterium]|nr:ABC transporter ATP-binding protein [Gemmataceae bacterium]